MLQNTNISDSTQYGIYIGDWKLGSSYNEIYHNNFINNPTQVRVDLGTGNSFDLGSKIGGNYWSDHVCTGNPSNGSEPYNFTGGVDNYPFQDPLDWIDGINISSLYTFNPGQDEFTENGEDNVKKTRTRGGRGDGGGATSYRVVGGDDSDYTFSGTDVRGFVGLVPEENIEIGLVEDDVFDDVLIGVSIGIITLMIICFKKKKRIK